MKDESLSSRRTLKSFLDESLHNDPLSSSVSSKIDIIQNYLNVSVIRYTDSTEWDAIMLGIVFTMIRDIHMLNYTHSCYTSKLPKYFESLVNFVERVDDLVSKTRMKERSDRLKVDLKKEMYKGHKGAKKKTTTAKDARKFGTLKPPKVGHPPMTIQQVMMDDHVRGKIKLVKADVTCPRCFHSHVYHVVKPSELFRNAAGVVDSWEEYTRGVKKSGGTTKAKRNQDASKAAGRAQPPMVVCMCSVNKARNAHGSGCFACEDRVKNSEEIDWCSLLNEVDDCNICECDCDLYFNLKHTNELAMYLLKKDAEKEQSDSEVKDRKYKAMKKLGPVPPSEYACSICIFLPNSELLTSLFPSLSRSIENDRLC